MKIRFGPYVIDPDLQELRGAEGVIELEPQVFALLSFLALNADRVVSKDEIFENVWDSRIVSDASLNTRINAARKAVGDDGKEQAVIRTYPRRGFRFVAEIETQTPTAPSGNRSRVVVLPLRTYSDNRELHHLADALTEDVIAELSHSRHFITLSYSSVRSLGDVADVEAMGRERKVRYVVEGGIRQMGNKIRVSATLSETGSGGVLWSEQYLREDEDFFAVEADIASRIVGAVEPVILAAERRRALVTERPSAWDYYLRGWHYLHNMGTLGQEGNVQQSIDAFRAALALDPDIPEANAGLGGALWQRASFNFVEDRGDIEEEAIFHARRAVILDNTNPELFAVLGTVLTHTGRTKEAVSTLKRGLALYPSNSLYKRWLGIALVANGDTSEAIEILDEAIESGGADPAIGPSYAWAALAHVFEGRFEEAEPYAREAVENPKTQFWANAALILSLHGQGRTEEVREELDALEAFKPGLTCTWVGRLTPITDPVLRERLLEGMRAAGLPD